MLDLLTCLMRCCLIRIFPNHYGFPARLFFVISPNPFLLHYTEALLSFIIKNGNSFLMLYLLQKPFYSCRRALICCISGSSHRRLPLWMTLTSLPAFWYIYFCAKACVSSRLGLVCMLLGQLAIRRGDRKLAILRQTRHLLTFNSDQIFYKV